MTDHILNRPAPPPVPKRAPKPKPTPEQAKAAEELRRVKAGEAVARAIGRG